MISVAEKLSGDFPYARIDLYNIKAVLFLEKLHSILGVGM